MSMKDHLNKKDVVGSIRLQLRHPSATNKIWIIVEGETDQKLFSKLINGRHVEIEISHGGLNTLLQSVSELLHETDHILGIRDADFLHLEEKNETAENIFITDFHDAEMMIISSNNAYNSVVAEYLIQEKYPYVLRDNILNSIAFIGGIRWINYTEILDLNFKKIGFGNFYDARTVSLDDYKCLDDILSRSPNRKKDISIQEVRLKIEGISDFLNLCNGHDFQKAFALCVSSTSKKGVNDVEIGKAFRVAYRFDDFQESKLYRQLKEWSDSQQKVLFE